MINAGPGLPPVKVHYAKNGDTLYEVEFKLGKGRRLVFRWRQPWARPEYIGAFELSGGQHKETPIPHGQRGAHRKEREKARSAVGRGSLQHAWLRIVQEASSCDVPRNNVRCLAERHTLLLPAELTHARKSKKRR
jgi:hypothetical protein